MKISVKLDVEDCRDCPFKRNHYGQGECWYECNHPESPKSYDSILWGCGEDFSKVPDWCPLGINGKAPE